MEVDTVTTDEKKNEETPEASDEQTNFCDKVEANKSGETESYKINLAENDNEVNDEKKDSSKSEGAIGKEFKEASDEFIVINSSKDNETKDDMSPETSSELIVINSSEEDELKNDETLEVVSEKLNTTMRDDDSSEFSYDPIIINSSQEDEIRYEEPKEASIVEINESQNDKTIDAESSLDEPIIIDSSDDEIISVPADSLQIATTNSINQEPVRKTIDSLKKNETFNEQTKDASSKELNSSVKEETKKRESQRRKNMDKLRHEKSKKLLERKMNSSSEPKARGRGRPKKETVLKPVEISSKLRKKRISQEGEQQKEQSKKQKTEKNKKELKQTVPPNLTFGFIDAGGPMGKHIINHLCNINEKFIFWHHEKYVIKGINSENTKVATSVIELFMESDVIIWHALSKRVSNEIFYGNFAFKNLLQGKYLIDLTNTDPENALEVYDTIHDEGGFYLDGRLHGSIQDAVEGKLVTFTSGDLVAHEACDKLLQSFSSRVKYFGSQPEKAARFSALINVVKAINLEAVHIMKTFAEAQDVVSFEELKKFATSPLGPLTKKAVEHKFENSEDRLYQLRTCKEDIESIIFNKNLNESENSLSCTKLLYKFICNYSDETNENSVATNEQNGEK